MQVVRAVSRSRWIVLQLTSFALSAEIQEQRIRNIVLVHGAWADGSGWKGVYDILVKDGYNVSIVQEPETSPKEDVAIVSQNGTAYEEGLGNAWDPIRRYWSEPSLENRESILKGLNLEGMRREYSLGVPNPDTIAPEGYTLDAALLARPGNVDIQLDLFLDYPNNVKLYPAFGEYFRKWKPPLLAIWGKYDPYFTPAGAEAFRRDNPNATVQLLDAGHFALETHVEEIAAAMKQFLARHAR